MASKKNGLITAVGAFVATASGICILIGFFQSVQFINNQFGLPMAAISLFLFPVTGTFIPLYAGITMGNWGIIALIWGGMLGVAVGSGIMDNKKWLGSL